MKRTTTTTPLPLPRTLHGNGILFGVKFSINSTPNQQILFSIFGHQYLTFFGSIMHRLNCISKSTLPVILMTIIVTRFYLFYYFFVLFCFVLLLLLLFCFVLFCFFFKCSAPFCPELFSPNSLNPIRAS